MEDFELSFDKENHLAMAARPDLRVVVKGEGGEVFHRRAIKLHADGRQEHVTMLVMRLKGVSVYFQDATLVVTEEDIYL